MGVIYPGVLRWTSTRRDMSKKADKLTDPVSRKALLEMAKALLEKHFKPWTRTERENALFKVATGLEMAA
jgi:hypothetical protein